MSYKLTQTGQEVQALLNQIKNGGQSQVTDAVLYTPQNLEEKKQEQARKNIGAAAENQIPTGAVLYSQKQDLESNQQAQARANIDAVGTEQLPKKVSELENDAHYLTENQVPTALPQEASALKSGNLPTSGWTIDATPLWEGHHYSDSYEGSYQILPAGSINFDLAAKADKTKWFINIDGGYESAQSVSVTSEYISLKKYSSSSIGYTIKSDGSLYSNTSGNARYHFYGVKNAEYGKIIYTISDQNITTNSDILMELTDDGGVKVYAMEAGSITVIRDAVPTSPIPYTYKVKQTNASGQFTLVNHYVPEVPEVPTSLPVTYKRVSGELPTTGWNPLGWEQSTLPSVNDWRSVAYGNDKFVAIGDEGGRGAYSTDGINWTGMTLPSVELWNGIAYGNGKFVAVATSTDKGAYSVDGINWTLTTMPSSPAYNNWIGVAYGNGKFVTLTLESSYCAYSTDGINWTSTKMPTKRNWRRIAYGNDKFVAVAKGTDKGAYSTDGITWTEMSMPASRNWQNVTYGDGKFVAVADGEKGAYSADGINWTEMTLPISRNWSCIAYGDGKFVAVEYNGIHSAYSTDGINWTAMTTPIVRAWSCVVYGDNKFVLVSSGAASSSQNNKALYWEVNSNKSTYTISDTFITTNTSVKMYLTDESMVKALRMSIGSITVLRDSVPTTAIPYKYEVKQTSTPGGFDVINSYVPTVPTKTSELTNDSGFVTQADIPATPTSLPVTYKKVSGSLPTSGWNTLWWKQNTMPTSASWSSVVYGDGKFVAVAEHGDKSAYSMDGINWIETTLPARKQWQSIAYGNGKFVAVAYSSAYGAYSIDGINWTNMMMSDLGNWVVTYGGSKFVAVSDSSVSAYSTDGINWIKTTLPASRSWQSIAYGNGKFVAVAWSSDKGAYSTDGINWIEMSMPASRMWRSVASEDGKFVAVAQNSDKGAYSTDGITWAEMSMPASRGWRSVASGDGKFVAVAYDSSVSAYSMDGINWIETTLPANQKWHSVTYGNGKYVAVAYPNTYGAYWNVFAPATYTIAITDTDITTNTSVKMYLTDEGGVKAYSKAVGSIQVIRDSVPTTAIPYEYEVEQTSAEGLFEVINAYVPAVPTKTSELTNDSGFLTKNNIVAGDNVTLTDENGNVKISATGGGSGGGGIGDWQTATFDTELEDGTYFIIPITSDLASYYNPILILIEQGHSGLFIVKNVADAGGRMVGQIYTAFDQKKIVQTLQSFVIISDENNNATMQAFEGAITDYGITSYKYIKIK